MPIVDVEVVAQSDLDLESTLASDLANALGQVFGSPPGKVWVRLRFLDGRHYAENDMAVATGELPVFVEVLQAHSPIGPTRSVEILAITRAVAAVVGRSHERVHVQYAPDAAGTRRSAAVSSPD